MRENCMVKVLVWELAGLRPQKSQYFSPSPKCGKDQYPSSNNQAQRVLSYWALLFHSGLQMIRWGPPTLGRTVCLTQSPDSDVNLIQKHPHRYTRMFAQMSGYCICPCQAGIYKINFHNENPWEFQHNLSWILLFDLSLKISLGGGNIWETWGYW